MASAGEADAEAAHPEISIVEHTVFFKFNDGYTEEQENDMYKGLWSFKEVYSSIMAMSLGRTLSSNAEGVTHVLYMRFPTKGALTEYLRDKYRVDISLKYIVPFFHGELVCDFEVEMERELCDLSGLYREGEKFKHGLEHLELFKTKEDASPSEVEDMLHALSELPEKLETSVVQLTAGANYTPRQKYTHGLVVRLPSAEALESFLHDPAYQEILERFAAILDDHFRADYLTDESLARLDEPYSR